MDLDPIFFQPFQDCNSFCLRENSEKYVLFSSENHLKQAKKPEKSMKKGLYKIVNIC